MSAISDTPAANEETAWEAVVVISTTSQHPFAASPGWRPAVNAYRCSDQFIVFVDLAGIARDSVEIATERGRLRIRGRRPPPEPSCLRSEPAQLLALEIDQGVFERVLDLPQDIEPRRVTTEYQDGLLKICLPLPA